MSSSIVGQEYVLKMKDLENTSLRGRVAFGIRCFENVLLELHYNLVEWKPVLEKLWLFTSH